MDCDETNKTQKSDGTDPTDDADSGRRATDWSQVTRLTTDDAGKLTMLTWVQAEDAGDKNDD